VSTGQVLMTLDTSDARRQLSDAQGQLQIAQARLQQLQTNLAAQQQARQQQAVLDDQRIQQQIADATAQAQQQLQKAQADYANVQAGAPAADRLAAQSGVASAQNALDKAQADLAKLQAGPTQAEIATAQQQVSTAQVALKKAQTERDNLVKPADPAALAAAQKDVADAQAALARANAPDDPHASGPKITADERQQMQSSAQFAVTAAKARLAALQKGPDKSAVDLATATVDSAAGEVATAQAHLSQLTAGPSPDDLTAANNAVQLAKMGVQGAQAKLDAINSHPTPQELDDAQQKIDAAQAGVDKASQPPVQTGPATPVVVSAATGQDASSSPAIEQMQLQHTAQQLQEQIQSLQQTLGASQIRAPFAGTIETVQPKVGDVADPSQAAMVIASAGPPLVFADASDTDARLAVGQRVDVQGQSADTASTGSIAALNANPSGSGQQVQIQVDWSGAPPPLGATVQLNVTLNTKQDVLLVPQQAVRTAGSRRTVEILDASDRRTVEVQTGVRSPDQVEIVSGLTEGQQVILPS
jgi:HlyD family secretion protein